MPIKEEPEAKHEQQSGAPAAAPAQPSYPTHPALGIWEKTITGTPPADDFTTQVANFLFTKVVANNDPALLWGQGTGPEIEVEAKLGHLIDPNSRERLRFPVMNECILSQGTELRPHFRSSMTEVRH